VPSETFFHANQIHASLQPLRDRYGDQPWLTVIGSIPAMAYRAAGLSHAAFLELLEAETERCGRLLIHVRRRANMALRKPLGDTSGGFFLEDGIVASILWFEGGGGYKDREWTAVLNCEKKPPIHLLVAPHMRRRLRDVVPTAPLALASATCVADEVEICIAPRGQTTSLRIRGRWETLGLMPTEVSRELKLPRQRSHDHIPWLGQEPASIILPDVAASGPAGQARGTSIATDRKGRPALSLVTAQ